MPAAAAFLATGITASAFDRVDRETVHLCCRLAFCTSVALRAVLVVQYFRSTFRLFEASCAPARILSRTVSPACSW